MLLRSCKFTNQYDKKIIKEDDNNWGHKRHPSHSNQICGALGTFYFFVIVPFIQTKRDPKLYCENKNCQWVSNQYFRESLALGNPEILPINVRRLWSTWQVYAFGLSLSTLILELIFWIANGLSTTKFGYHEEPNFTSYTLVIFLVKQSNVSLVLKYDKELSNILLLTFINVYICVILFNLFLVLVNIILNLFVIDYSWATSKSRLYWDNILLLYILGLHSFFY